MAQNNRMLQARYRYLQARRDLEHAKLKEDEALTKLLAERGNITAPVEIKIEEPVSDLPRCLKCGAIFKAKAGLTSHMRHRTCEEK